LAGDTRSSAEARPRLRELVTGLNWLATAAAIIVVSVTVGFAYARTNGAFNSPDDASNFATAQAIVEDGHPWLETPHGVTDEFDMLHPRAFVTVDDRAVPIQSLVNPALHALIWKVTGSYAVSAGLFVAIGLAGWTLLTARIFGVR